MAMWSVGIWKNAKPHPPSWECAHLAQDGCSRRLLVLMRTGHSELSIQHHRSVGLLERPKGHQHCHMPQKSHCSHTYIHYIRTYVHTYIHYIVYTYMCVCPIYSPKKLHRHREESPTSLCFVQWNLQKQRSWESASALHTVSRERKRGVWCKPWNTIQPYKMKSKHLYRSGVLSEASQALESRAARSHRQGKSETSWGGEHQGRREADDWVLRYR